MRGRTNKSPIKLNAAGINLTRVICFRMGKSNMEKTSLGEFEVTTLENSLLSQAVISKEIPVSYTNLQLNLYPNTQWDLFCSDNLSISMHDS